MVEQKYATPRCAANRVLSSSALDGRAKPANKASARPPARTNRLRQTVYTGGGLRIGASGCLVPAVPSSVLDAGGFGAQEIHSSVIVHLIDGTYELFRHFYGLRRFTKGVDRPFGAVGGVLNTVLQMIDEGATHVGVATDHVIESFRNALWSGYKTGAGIEPALRAQFGPLEEALGAMGIAVWPMIELEADDALASAAAAASQDSRVQKICIWTPDKDLAQCVREDRIVQIDRKSKVIRDAHGVQAKFGVSPALIPDYLALVGDAADGYPGIAGIGPKGAVALLSRYGKIEDFPVQVLGERRDLALLFKNLATLRADAALFSDVDELEWRGPTEGFSGWSDRLGGPGLLARAQKAFAKRA
jgi:5'-3' exonuclease